MPKKVPASFLGLELAGFRIAFGFDEPRFKELAARRYKKFIARGTPRAFSKTAGARGKPLCRFSVRAAAGRQAPYKPLIRSCGNLLELARGDFSAVLNLETGLGELRAAPNEQCFDAFLRSLLSFLLIRSGGLMLHSAGLVKGGKAYIFLGKSGAGKSTLSRLAAAAGAEVISDELNLVRYKKGRFMVYGSPFWGEMRSAGRPGAWPLGGVFRLKKAGTNRVSPCSKPEALRLLLRCLVNFYRGPEAAALALENSARLLSSVRVSTLEFSKKNGGFLNLV